MSWNLIASGEHIGEEAVNLFEDLKAVFAKWGTGLKEAQAVVTGDGAPQPVSLAPPPPEPAPAPPAPPAETAAAAASTAAAEDSRLTALESAVTALQASVQQLVDHTTAAPAATA